MFSLILEKKNGLMIPFAEIAHHTFTFWAWRGISWSKRGFAPAQYLKFCLQWNGKIWDGVESSYGGGGDEGRRPLTICTAYRLVYNGSLDRWTTRLRS
jgi:hypothetical protein